MNNDTENARTWLVNRAILAVMRDPGEPPPAWRIRGFVRWLRAYCLWRQEWQRLVGAVEGYDARAHDLNGGDERWTI